jgi:serine/threonine protein kinase
VVQPLGEGGFGRVVLVRNRKRNVQFAMKELSESSPDMYREVELMVTLTRTNPHVVSYFDRFVRTDAATGERRYCIMMDYVRGLNLLDYVKKKKTVNNSIVYWFLRSALEALAHLHDMRVAHRDIKPENYIVAPYRLDGDGSMVQRLVTIDFGLGSFLKRGGQLYVNDAEEVVGTPNYSSPQVIDADNAGEVWLDAKSDDVWALGASFYYLCSGKHVAPFQPGGSWTRSWKEVMKFQCPEVVWPHHALLNGIITAALARDHEKRPSAAELLSMLMEGWREEDATEVGHAVAVPVATTPTVAKGAANRAALKRTQSEPPEPASPPNGVAKRVKDKKPKALAAAVVTARAARYPLRSRSNK